MPYFFLILLFGTHVGYCIWLKNIKKPTITSCLCFSMNWSRSTVVLNFYFCPSIFLCFVCLSCLSDHLIQSHLQLSFCWVPSSESLRLYVIVRSTLQLGHWGWELTKTVKKTERERNAACMIMNFSCLNFKIDPCRVRTVQQIQQQQERGFEELNKSEPECVLLRPTYRRFI